METRASKNQRLRQLPSVETLLGTAALRALAAKVGRAAVTRQARVCLAALRAEWAAADPAAGELPAGPDIIAGLCRDIEMAAVADCRGSAKAVFNLTGTVIHSNLGRAALPAAAVAAMADAATRPFNLEYDLRTGARGDRDVHVESLVRELTGAEAATVVNNNAAAVLLVANTFAAGREVLVSRGELVEIGGAFRIPDVMRGAGCRLVEVGTTNRTHLRDYADAIGADTALLMKVHASNYEIRGFVSAVGEGELATLARARALPFVSDLGSGALVSLRPFGLPDEPTARQVLAAGTDLVCFSGDKLLGGPQAGIIAGRASLIERLKRNPLKRALRLDKTRLLALAATLRLYRDPATLPERLPLLKDCTRPRGEIEELARRLLTPVAAALASRATVAISPCASQIGSGALPVDTLPSCGLRLEPAASKGQTEATLLELATDLRALPRPVLGRLRGGGLQLDLRTLREEDEFLGQLAQLRR